ncbi:MAG: T9SS type A sorting domain-containing protein [Bacteroidota bacterium]|nr:T9SS type A sorting domain-containing protein [Bacteroidota bacterium]
MKKIISLQVFLFATLVMFGQQFTLSQKTINLDAGLGGTLAKVVQITNNSSTDSDFTWNLLNSSLKNTWVATLCDPNVCHNMPFSSSNPFVVGKNKTKTFTLDVETMSECGSGQIALAIMLNSDPTKIDTLIFNLKTWCAGIEDMKSKTPNVILYDAADAVQISGISDFKQVKILDMNGRAVSTQQLNGNDLQSISLPLPKGVYVFHFEKFGIEINVKFVKL